MSDTPAPDALASANTRQQQVKALCDSPLASVPVDLYSCIVGQVHVLTQVLEKLTTQLKLQKNNVTAHIEGEDNTLGEILDISHLLLDAAKDYGKPTTDNQ